MAVNRPAGQSWESYTDAQLRIAGEHGAFDNLPGAGKPIPGLDQNYDENWWLKEYLKRENLSALPQALAFKTELAQLIERLWRVPGEVQLREEIAKINQRIEYMNASVLDGLALDVSRMDVEETVKTWRTKREHPPSGK
jgi:hypothetical protein